MSDKCRKCGAKLVDMGLLFKDMRCPNEENHNKKKQSRFGTWTYRPGDGNTPGHRPRR